MNRASIATLTLRLFALYLWLEAFFLGTANLAFLIFAKNEPKPSGFSGVTITLLVGYGALGAVLWFASRKWGERMFGVEGSSAIRAREIGTLALRLVGIWLLVFALRDSADVITMLDVFGSASRGVVVPRFASAALEIGLSSTLLLGGTRIARRLFPDAENPQPTASNLQPIAFSVIGLIVVANALPVLVSNLVTLGSWFEEDGRYFESGDRSTSRFVAAVVRVALGLWLFLGSGSLVRAWRWVQTAGLDRKSVSHP